MSPGRRLRHRSTLPWNSRCIGVWSFLVLIDRITSLVNRLRVIGPCFRAEASRALLFCWFPYYLHCCEPHLCALAPPVASPTASLPEQSSSSVVQSCWVRPAKQASCTKIKHHS